MYGGVLDLVDVPEGPQHPAPQDDGDVREPALARATCQHRLELLQGTWATIRDMDQQIMLDILLNLNQPKGLVLSDSI